MIAKELWVAITISLFWNLCIYFFHTNVKFAEGLAILARIDPKLDLAKKLNNAVIGTLYDTFPHPPVSYLGPDHSFRHANGGGNNLQSPEIGRAGTPYVRSVQGKGGLPRSSLPDPGLVFDTLLKRREVRIISDHLPIIQHYWVLNFDCDDSKKYTLVECRAWSLLLLLS